MQKHRHTHTHTDTQTDTHFNIYGTKKVATLLYKFLELNYTGDRQDIFTALPGSVTRW